MGICHSKKVNLNPEPLEEKMSTESLVSNLGNQKTVSLLQSYGLTATKIAWEDSARTKNSCFGPNISDMTLVTSNNNLMPVIRKPNFADVTYDVPIESFKLLSDEGKVVSLKTFLESFEGDKILCERDKVVLTSTQCCVLPVEKGKKTEFAVQLFNYQSWADDPAVMVILASKYGTSVRFVSSSNNKLFFNDKGTSRWFSVERLEDSRERRGEAKTRVDSYKEMKTEEQLENTLLMIQVPLKQRKMPNYVDDLSNLSGGLEGSMCGSMGGLGKDGCMGGFKGSTIKTAKDSGFDGKLKSLPKKKYGNTIIQRNSGCSGEPNTRPAVQSSGMDMGQIGLGQSHGYYPSIKGKKILRDDRFPIRVTVQYYRVTDCSNILEKDVKDIADQLNSVTQKSVASGSLVFENTDRVTEPNLPQNPVVDWGDNVMV